MAIYIENELSLGLTQTRDSCLISLPPHSHRLRSKLITIEIMGLPRAGKSTMLEDLEIGDKDNGNYEPKLVVPEFSYPVAELSPDAPKLNNIHQKAYFLGISILNSFTDGYKTANQLSQRSSQPTLYLSERGPNDFLASERWEEALHPNREDSCPNEVDPDWDRYYFPNKLERDRLFKKGAYLTRYVDAVILYKVSLETAMRRRELQGLPREGRIVNSTLWSALEKGYNWWLNCLYPRLRDSFGTGLLLIDGEDDLYQNNRRVFEYLNYLKDRNTAEVASC